MYKLKIILASTRSGRKGPAVAEWVTSVAKADARFETELVDLKTVNLPFLDEPDHPRLRKYTHDHTKAWSAKVEEGDAFIFVMPEYNFGYSAPLKNAIDHLFQEWQYKPVGLVSYGGVSGGLRATQSLKPVLTAVQLTVAAEMPIPSFAQFIHAQGAFQPNELLSKAAPNLLNGIAKWAAVLGPMRAARMGS